eukprot:scaffold2808_cov255-Pinguiococcus_pyrenoidosus.AAC.41
MFQIFRAGARDRVSASVTSTIEVLHHYRSGGFWGLRKDPDVSHRMQSRELLFRIFERRLFFASKALELRERTPRERASGRRTLAPSLAS